MRACATTTTWNTRNVGSAGNNKRVSSFTKTIDAGPLSHLSPKKRPATESLPGQCIARRAFTLSPSRTPCCELLHINGKMAGSLDQCRHGFAINGPGRMVAQLTLAHYRLNLFDGFHPSCSGCRSSRIQPALGRRRIDEAISGIEHRQRERERRDAGECQLARRSVPLCAGAFAVEPWPYSKVSAKRSNRFGCFSRREMRGSLNP